MNQHTVVCTVSALTLAPLFYIVLYIVVNVGLRISVGILPGGQDFSRLPQQQNCCEWKGKIIWAA